MRLSGLLAAAALSGLAVCQVGWAAEQADAAIRAELEEMFFTDQAQRAEIQARSLKHETDTPEFRALSVQQHLADQANIKRLQEIVDSYGWPLQSKVGGKAAIAAWAVVQHADLSYQKQFLPMLRDAVAKGEAWPQNLALLEDRILVGDGKTQLYGSQINIDKNTHVHSFKPIVDEANVDKRRAAVGLGPLSEYAKHFGFDYPGNKEQASAPVPVPPQAQSAPH